MPSSIGEFWPTTWLEEGRRGLIAYVGSHRGTYETARASPLSVTNAAIVSVCVASLFEKWIDCNPR